MTGPTKSPENAVPAKKLCRQFRLLIAIAGLILIGQTHALWFGLHASFPQVPLPSLCVGCPTWLDVLLGGLMVVALGGLLFSRTGGKFSTWPNWLFVAAFAAAVLLNQHRLQPWAWEFSILLVVLACLPAPRAVPCLQLFVASIYLHSGLSKLDVTFLTTHGEAFVSVLTNTVGWDLASAPAGVRRALVAMLPVGEIAVAIGFCIPKTQRLAKWCSVGMHIMLLWILGPWGLDHKPGVLIWNIYFILQNLILFRPVFNPSDQTADQRQGEKASARPIRIGFGYAVAAAAMLFPFLEPFGFFDHWPAWAVYASRPEQTRVYIAENRIGDLPEAVQEFVIEEPASIDNMERWLAGKPPWHRLRIDHWSLEALDAPIYPQDRFQIGVALALAEKFQLGDGIRVEIDSPADRRTGKRSRKVIEGTTSLREAADDFRLNALPR